MNRAIISALGAGLDEERSAEEHALGNIIVKKRSSLTFFALAVSIFATECHATK
jgi:hypothetical protein